MIPRRRTGKRARAPHVARTGIPSIRRPARYLRRANQCLDIVSLDCQPFDIRMLDGNMIQIDVVERRALQIYVGECDADKFMSSNCAPASEQSRNGIREIPAL